MVIDTSALVAILLAEPERAEFLSLIRAAEHPVLSAATYTEIGVVLDARAKPVLSRQFDALLDELRIETMDLTAAQARTAREAYRDFGKGSGHPARLNLGDCFSYALAAETDQPLLFKGEDLVHTDIRRAR